MSDWINHEKRVVDIVSTIRNTEHDLRNIKSNNPVLWIDKGIFCLKFWASKDELKKEFELYLPMLKEKNQCSRRTALRKLNLEFEERFTEWCKHLRNLGFIDSLPRKLKDEGDLLKFCKSMDQFSEMTRNLSSELDTINNLMKQEERSSKVKSSIQKLQEFKSKLDKVYESVCSQLKTESIGELSMFEKEIRDFSVKIQQATTDSLNYVDRLNEVKDHWNQPISSDGLGETTSMKDIPVTSTGDEGSQTRQSANDTLEKSLKLLRDVKQPTAFDKSENRTGVAPRHTRSATLSTVKRRSLVDFSPSRTLPKSDICKPLGSRVGSELSRVSELRRLEMHAKVLEQKSQLEIEKRQRELKIEKTKKQMEMEMHQKLLDLQAEAEIAEMESRKAFEQHEMRLQIEEAEGSVRALSICPSLMSLTLEEDKNSDIRSWLERSDENLEKGFSQPKESRREVEIKYGSRRLPQRFPKHSPQRNQLLTSQPQSRGTSKSPPRKNAGISFPKTNPSLQQRNDEPKPKHEFANPTFKVENPFLSFTPALPVQRPVLFVQTSLPKLKLSDFHGDPLEWPEWSSVYSNLP